MAAFTSKATGNWSSSGQTTWNEVGVPGAGDTVSIGAHTITVSDTRIIGTSPNDSTTKVIDITSGSGVLIVNASLTIRGNFGMVDGSTLTLGAGGSILFDPSAAGGGAGLPVYTLINTGFCRLNGNGTSGSHCAMSAPSDYTFSLNESYSQLQVTYCDFTRVAAGNFLMGSGVGASITRCTFTSCGFLQLSSTVTNQDFYFNYNRFDGSGADSFRLTLDGIPTTSNPRELVGNSFDGAFTYNSQGITGRSNYFGGGIDGVGGSIWDEFRLNLIKGTRADGQRLEGLLERNYFTSDGGGNPHFIEVRTSTADFIFSQNIIEAHDPDLIDMGDVILAVENRFTPPFICVGKNNIVLRDSSAPVSSGTLITLYNAGADVVTEWYRNTCNIDNPASGSFVRRSPFATSEAGAGAAGQVAALKSNLVWGTSAGQGYIAERVNNFPASLDVITAAGADYNWAHNLTVGNNQRYYQSQQFSGPLWTAGDAVAASVDTNQGEGDPQFYDRNRNLASWTQERGYGSTYADGLAAVRSDPLRAADLITYVFEGFRPSNAATRNAAHDGGCVGAANFYKAARTFSEVTAHRATLSKFGL